MEQDEKVWRRIFLPVERTCSNPKCRKHFVCTGMCPALRWNLNKDEMHITTACFCKKCLEESTFSSFYKEERLRLCYEEST